VPLEVINDFPVIHIHIPKTAGTSIKKYFGFYEDCHRTAQDFLSSINGRIVPISINAHEETRVYKNQISRQQEIQELIERKEARGGHLFRDAFKFSFVRNPWDRIASIYHYHKDDPAVETFNEFVNELKNKNGAFFSSTSKSILKLTQTQYLSVGNSICVENNAKYPDNKEGVLAMNYIGKFETIKTDVEKITEAIWKKPKVRFANETPVSVYNQGPPEAFEGSKYRWRPSDNNKQSYTKMYKKFDNIYTVFDYYYDDVVNFNYTFSGAPYCEITQECFKIKAQENANF